jgi:hypothetical protein
MGQISRVFSQDEMAITPVVAFVGNDVNLCPSKEQVAEAFVIPLTTLMDSDWYVDW